MASGAPLELPMPPEVLAVILLRRSKAYYEGFSRLSSDDTRQENPDLRHPAYFLYTHAIELAMKAFLAANGMDEKRLMKIGHQLDHLLKSCIDDGLSAVSGLEEVVLTLTEMNQDQDLRYPTPFNLHVPAPWYCAETFEALEEAIAPRVERAQLAAEAELEAISHANGGVTIRFIPTRPQRPRRS